MNNQQRPYGVVQGVYIDFERRNFEQVVEFIRRRTSNVNVANEIIELLQENWESQKSNMEHMLLRHQSFCLKLDPENASYILLEQYRVNFRDTMEGAVPYAVVVLKMRNTYILDYDIRLES